MKIYLKVILVLLFVGITLGIYYNIPQETIKVFDIPATKLPAIQMPMASENGGFTGGTIGG